MEWLLVTAAEDIRYTVLRINDRKRQTHDVPAAEEWDDVCTFFIYSLGKEEVSHSPSLPRIEGTMVLWFCAEREQKCANVNSSVMKSCLNFID